MLTEKHILLQNCCSLCILHLKAASLTRAHTKDRQTAAVDKMVPFNTKIWFMHRLAVVHAGPKQSGMQPVTSNSCALSNKWCIHKTGKASV